MFIDEEILCIKKVLRCNTEAYEYLVLEYQNLVYGLIFHLVKDQDTAEQIAIDVFVEAYKKLRPIKRKYVPSIFREAFNRASQCVSEDIENEDASIRISLYGAMCRLSDQDLRLLILRDCMHVPYDKLCAEHREDMCVTRKRVDLARQRVWLLMKKV